MKAYIAPAYDSQIIDDGYEFFLGKLIKRVTNKVTAPTLKKVTTAIAQSGASDQTKAVLTQSANQVQKDIVEESPAGALKSVALAASIVTLGASSAVTATGLSKVAAAGTAAFKSDGLPTPADGYQWPADAAASAEVEQDKNSNADMTGAITIGAIVVASVVVLIMVLNG